MAKTICSFCGTDINEFSCAVSSPDEDAHICSECCLRSLTLIYRENEKRVLKSRGEKKKKDKSTSGSA